MDSDRELVFYQLPDWPEPVDAAEILASGGEERGE